MKNLIGLDIGGTKILGALYDEKGNILAQAKKKTKASEGMDVVIERIYKVIDQLIEENKNPLDGIGVAVPGLISDQGVVTFSPNIPFKNFDLSSLLINRYHVPVVVGNDVNVAMYGEYKHTNQQHIKNVLGLFIGTGVGGAIIIDGKLYTGQGAAAEFGHMIVNSDGAFCGCGSQGCLEAYASKTAMQKYIEQALRKGRSSVLSDFKETDGEVLKSSTLKNAYDAKDQLAIDTINNALKYLGVALGSLINIFHPELIILGGGIMEAMGMDLLSKILDQTAYHTMPGLLETVEFRLSELADEAGIYGAFELINNNL